MTPDAEYMRVYNANRPNRDRSRTPRAARTKPDTGFMADALCRGADPDLFFIDAGTSANHAKQVCSSCPVRAECLEYALAHRETHGIWGGATEQERRGIRRQRRNRGAA